MKETRSRYQIMEWHRGEFIPLKTTKAQGEKGEGKTVYITEQSAEELNRDFSYERGQGVKVKYMPVEDNRSETKPVEKEEGKKVKKEGKIEKVEGKIEKVEGGDKKEWQKIYQEAFEKKPFYGWTIEELKEKIENK